MHGDSVAIDTKNLALYGRGISGFVRPLIAAGLSHSPRARFSFIGPAFNAACFAGHNNWTHEVVSWPGSVPRSLRHPIYDNVLFPGAIARVKPNIIFSPYHDVLLPRSRNIYSIMTVHDTCLDDVRSEYPVGIPLYFLGMLRRNLRRAAHVLTVSNASRDRIIDRYHIPASKVTVVENSIDPEFDSAPVEHSCLERLRKRFGTDRLVFYPGGPTWRKNMPRLLQAFALLLASGRTFRLLVTGVRCPTWMQELAKYSDYVRDRVTFLGVLPVSELKAHYAVSDAVVYPTLCEGFGRVCIEAMWVGTSLACSDLPVLREVAGDYALYFNPTDPAEIAAAIDKASSVCPLEPRRDARFLPQTVTRRFIDLLDRLLA